MVYRLFFTVSLSHYGFIIKFQPMAAFRAAAIRLPRPADDSPFRDPPGIPAIRAAQHAIADKSKAPHWDSTHQHRPAQRHIRTIHKPKDKGNDAKNRCPCPDSFQLLHRDLLKNQSSLFSITKSPFSDKSKDGQRHSRKKKQRSSESLLLFRQIKFSAGTASLQPGKTG